MSTSIRTVWITIRAMNYTVNVFNDVIRQITITTQNMNNMAIASMNMAKAALSAGILFQVLGSQIGGVGGQVLQFGSYIMYGIAALQALLAITKLVNMENLTKTIPIGHGISVAYWELFAVVGVAAGIFYALQGYLGTIPALLIAIAAAAAILAVVLWQAAGAMSVVTGGAAGFGGAAGIAAAKAAAAYTVQMGTRMVGETGPAILHKGEVVYNPATGRPTQIGNDLAMRGGGTTTIDASMYVENLQTKMDKEELNDLLRKQGRTIAQNNR